MHSEYDDEDLNELFKFTDIQQVAIFACKKCKMQNTALCDCNGDLVNLSCRWHRCSVQLQLHWKHRNKQNTMIHPNGKRIPNWIPNTFNALDALLHIIVINKFSNFFVRPPAKSIVFLCCVCVFVFSILFLIFILTKCHTYRCILLLSYVIVAGCVHIYKFFFVSFAYILCDGRIIVFALRNRS